MTQPAKSQEPSMEEILASIRRIIADDDASKSAQREAPKPAPAPPPAPPPPPPVQAAPQPAPQRPPPPPPEPEPEPEPVVSELEAPPAAEEFPPAAEDDSADILDLTESMAAPEPDEAPQFRTIDGNSDVGFDDEPEKPAPPPIVEEPRPSFAPARDDDRGRLLSSHTSAAVDSAFNTLAQTVLVQNARTLEDLVREMLRPMLKTWLDDNLPGMVERLVRAEIERVSRGR
jgi:uncharacterized protein